MIDKMTQRLDFHGNALVLRAERQRLLASNIANADTPGYQSRDFDFAKAMRAANQIQESEATLAPQTTNARHLPLRPLNTERGESVLAYGQPSQPSLDNNTVDMDRERAAFVNNAVRYEATLRFINGNAKTMLSAIQGQ